MLHISCIYKSKRNDFIEGQLYGTNTSAFVHSADDKICIRFYALFFLEHLLRSTAMQMCLIMINIPNQKYGQKNLPVWPKLLSKNHTVNKEAILDTSKIVLTAKGGYTWAVRVDKFLRDSLFHELFDLGNSKIMTSILKGTALA